MDPMGIGDYTTHVKWGLIIINHEMRICFLNNQDTIWKVRDPGFFSWLKWRLERGKQKRWKLFERMNGCYYGIKITDILK